MKKITLNLVIVAIGFIALNAQVKIGDNHNTINANSMLELESSYKGCLPPRIELNNLDSDATNVSIQSLNPLIK